MFTVRLSNQGGTVRSWKLKNYKGNDDKTLDLVNAAAGMDYPFSFHIPGHDAAAKTLNWAWYQAASDPDGLGVTYTFSNRHVAAKKTFRFEKDSYISKVSAQVTIDGEPVESEIEWRGGFGDLGLTDEPANSHALYFDVPNNKLNEPKPNSAKGGPIAATRRLFLRGLADKYFAAVFLPPANVAMRETTFTDYVPTVVEYRRARRSPAWRSPMASPTNDFQLFVGPKDYDMLSRINPKLQQMISFGWMALLARPLFLLTNWFNDAFVHSFGWSIVAGHHRAEHDAVPHQAVEYEVDAEDAGPQAADRRHQREVQEHQPARPARRPIRTQEVMDLYKKNGVNPHGRLLPMLMQIPFFFAFYTVFRVSVEMRGAQLAVGEGSFPGRAAAHPHSAHHHDRQPVRHAEDDAPAHRRSQPAEDDDVHAADFRLHVLQFPQRPGVILLDQQSGKHGATVVLQPDRGRGRSRPVR